jgi:hypothetical protein
VYIYIYIKVYIYINILLFIYIYIYFSLTACYFDITTMHCIYSHVHFVIFSCINKQSHITLNDIKYIKSPMCMGWRCLTVYLPEKRRHILNLRNVHLSNFFPQKWTFKNFLDLRVPYIQSNMEFKQFRYFDFFGHW